MGSRYAGKARAGSFLVGGDYLFMRAKNLTKEPSPCQKKCEFAGDKFHKKWYDIHSNLIFNHQI